MDEQRGEKHEERDDPCKVAAGELEPKRRLTCAAHPTLSRWRNPGKQQSYASNLLEALRHVRRREGPDAPPRSRAVLEAANRVLAAAARGRTRWSRALLARCRALKSWRRRRAAARKPVPPPGALGKRKAPAPPVARKMRVLGRLVPGSQRLLLPSLLEEAADYIAALQMQVRAMSALAETLSSLDNGSSQPDA